MFYDFRSTIDYIMFWLEMSLHTDVDVIHLYVYPALNDLLTKYPYM